MASDADGDDRHAMEVVRTRLTMARVGHLATVDADGDPRVVPCCFALVDDVVFTAVDDVKAKSTLDLRRLDDIRRHPRATLLVDHYAEDWSTLWWLRVSGPATVFEPGSPDHRTAIAALVDKYEQYRRQPPPGHAIAITVERWRSWQAR